MAQATPMRSAPQPIRAPADPGWQREFWSTRDGWVVFRAREVALCAGGWRALVAWLTEFDTAPDWLLAIDSSDARSLRVDAETIARIEQTLASFFAAHTREELFACALARGLPLAPCNDADAVSRQPQLRARGLFQTLDLPACDATIELPGAFARSSEFSIGVRRRAPRIGEHQQEVFSEAGIGQAECEKLASEGIF